MYRREMRTIIGVYGEELTVDYLNVTAVRIKPWGTPEGEWKVCFRLYDNLEEIEVANKASASRAAQDFIDFTIQENKEAD